MCSTANTIHCLRAIQKIAGDSEETKYRMSHEILTTFAPPQHWENAWTNVWRTLWAFNSSRSVCFVLWVNHLFFRRCPTVPVYRRPVRNCQWTSFNSKKRPTFWKCIPTIFFFTPNIQNHLIGFWGAETFWERDSSWRPVQRRLAGVKWQFRSKIY